MPNHTVTPGDCFNSIAKEKGFYNYQTVYNHGQNSKNWKNPNILEEGGTVEVPDKKVKKLPLKLDQENNFVVDRKKTRLRVVLVDADFKPLKVKTSELTAGVKSTKKPDGKGLIEIPDVDPTIKSGTLDVELEKPAPPAAAPAPAAAPPDPNAYPPVIVEKDFEDKNPKTEDMLKVQWDLQIGALEPHTTVRGVMQRLVNFGFGCPVTKTEDDKTKAAVSTYQLALKLKAKGQETGLAKDIQSDIETRHDKL